MKEMWEAPRVAVQTFVPGEYAATCCIEVACLAYKEKTLDPLNLGNDGRAMWSSWVDDPSKRQNRYENDENGNKVYWDEHSQSCSHTGNNYLYTDGNASNALGIWEHSLEQKKDLSGEVTYWQDKDRDQKYTAGDLIAWVTYNTKAYWRHWGYLGNQDNNRPNHS